MKTMKLWHTILLIAAIISLNCNKKKIIPRIETKKEPIKAEIEVKTQEPEPVVEHIVVEEDPTPEEFKGVFYFGFDEYTLSYEENEKLKGFIKEIPNDYYLLFVGHTCPIGAIEYNHNLGLKRAVYVCEISDLSNISEIKSYGENNPVTLDALEYGLNRRVVVYAGKEKVNR